MSATIWMSGALLSFCLMAIGARELSGEMNTFQILFFRSLIGFAVISLIIYKSKQNVLFSTNRLRLHFGRNIFHFLGQYGWFIGIGLLPLAQVFALEFTTPIWTLVVASIFLKESLTIKKITAILLGSVGVYLILNPSKEIVNFAALYVIGAAIFYALAYVSTKSLTTTDNPLTVLFYMCAIQLPIGFVLGLSSFITPNTTQWLWLTLIGLTALTAHFCITNAMKKAEASIVVTLDFLRLPLISVVGVAFYSEAFNPALLLGAVLMLLGNLINIYKPRVV